MRKKYVLLYLVALIVISGCIEFPQTQAEKIGWKQAKYEGYSAYYDIRRPPPEKIVSPEEYNAISKNLTIDEWLISIPKDENEFENTWYLVFYYIKKGQDEPIGTFCNLNPDELRMIDPKYQQSYKERVCRIILEQKRMEQANVSYSKAAEYRQKIEEMKP